MFATLFNHGLSKIDQWLDNQSVCYISSTMDECRFIKAKLLSKGMGYIVPHNNQRTGLEPWIPGKKPYDFYAFDMKNKDTFLQLISLLSQKLRNSFFLIIDNSSLQDSHRQRIKQSLEQIVLNSTKLYISNEEKNLHGETLEQIFEKFDSFLFSAGGLITTIENFKGFEIQNIATLASQIKDET